MHFVRYRSPAGEIHVGSLRESGLSRLPVRSMEHLLTHTLSDIITMVQDPALPVESGTRATLLPIDGRTEIWASGVTYLRSRDARVEESSHQNVYQQIYEAERPELFYKGVAWRAMADGDPVSIRSDSTSDVPEPELAMLLNSGGETVGYLVCNDMSSRSIEAENPLYLPQAKIYAGSCALSSSIRAAWEVDPTDFRISMSITRHGRMVFAGDTSTGRMKRGLGELARWLFSADHFPAGVVLSTGTGIVPPLDFSLRAGDTVDIQIEGVGSLRNDVTRGMATPR